MSPPPCPRPINVEGGRAEQPTRRGKLNAHFRFETWWLRTHPNIEHMGYGVFMRTLTRCMRWAFICPAPGSEMCVCIEIVWLESRQSLGHAAPHTGVLSYSAMGKHLTADELDSVQAWRSQGISSLEIHRRLQHARATGREMDPICRSSGGRCMA